jgi:hypothetical protein
MTESSAKIVYRTLSHRKNCFANTQPFGKNCLGRTQYAVKQVGKFSKLFAMAEPLLKVICRELSHQQKLFPVGWDIIKNYFSHADSSAKNARIFLLAKIVSRELSLRFKLFPKSWVISKNFFLRAECLRKKLTFIFNSISLSVKNVSSKFSCWGTFKEPQIINI